MSCGSGKKKKSEECKKIWKWIKKEKEKIWSFLLLMAVARAPLSPGTGRKQQQQRAAPAQISGLFYGGSDETQWRLGRSLSSSSSRARDLPTSCSSLDAAGAAATTTTPTPTTIVATAAAAATAYSSTTREGLISAKWCGCVTRSGALSPPPPSSRTSSRAKKDKSGEMKSGDISALVKSYERSVTPGGSPFRPRLSPGKVSPLMEVVPPTQAAAAAAAVAPASNLTPAVFSMSSSYYLSTEKMSNAGGVSSSPPVEKMIKASPTLFEMMSHEQQQEPGQQQQQQEPKLLQNTISLSQQLTFQEKMKTILAGIASYYSPLSHYFLLLSKEKKKKTKERIFLPSFTWKTNHPRAPFCPPESFSLLPPECEAPNKIPINPIRVSPFPQQCCGIARECECELAKECKCEIVRECGISK